MTKNLKLPDMTIFISFKKQVQGKAQLVKYCHKSQVVNIMIFPTLLDECACLTIIKMQSDRLKSGE